MNTRIFLTPIILKYYFHYVLKSFFAYYTKKIRHLMQSRLFLL